MNSFYNCCKNTNARGIVIVSYHSYLIIDLIRYLSLFTITLYMYFKYFLTFMNWENSDKIEIFSKIQYTELKLSCGNDPVVNNSIYSNGDLDLW
jgi:hypothetical protein